MNSSSQRRSTRAVRPRPRSSKVGDTSTPARGALSNSKLGPGARTMEPNWTGKGKATGNVPRPVPSRSLSPATSPLASSGATGPFNECSKAILYISVSSGGAVSLLLLPPPPPPSDHRLWRHYASVNDLTLKQQSTGISSVFQEDLSFATFFRKGPVIGLLFFFSLMGALTAQIRCTRIREPRWYNCSAHNSSFRLQIHSS